MRPHTLARLTCALDPERLAPRYLSARDLPWVQALLGEYRGFAGGRQSELVAHLREHSQVPAPRAKRELLIEVLDGLCRSTTTSSVPPSEARFCTFTAAAANPKRDEALTRAASALGIGVAELEASLFADLRGQRRVAPLPPGLTAESLCLEANLVLVSAFLRRARSVRIAAHGSTGRLVGWARRLGLLCLARRGTEPGCVELEISGPLALFRRTSVYARALAALVRPALRCERFEIAARCALTEGAELCTVVVRSGDPIADAPRLANFDIPVVDTFIRAFARRKGSWELVPEPPPLEASGALHFPDFAVADRSCPERHCFVEVVGFWTREYLQKKLERLRLLPGPPVLICVDERQSCGEDEPPDHAALLRYRKRLDPSAVLQAVERLTRAAASQ